MVADLLADLPADDLATLRAAAEIIAARLADRARP